MALDFTAVTSAIDATTIVLAITAVAAIKILPGVAIWGFNKVVCWFGMERYYIYTEADHKRQWEDLQKNGDSF